MKGEKVVTNLVPYGAEKPRVGMVKKGEGNPGTNQVEIFWHPPPVEFSKYVLNIGNVSVMKSSTPDVPKGNFMRMTSTNSKDLMIPLSNKLTTYTILGLDPGELYAIELGTKPGGVLTRQLIHDLILTKPMPPRNVHITGITTNSCVLNWIAPPVENTCLKEFQIEIKLDSTVKEMFAVSKIKNKFTVFGSNKITVFGLSSGKDYDISIKSVCEAEGNRRTESVPIQVSVTTELE